MPDTVQTAPEQPAQVAQTSSEKKNVGSSLSDLSKRLLASAQAAASAPETSKAEAEPTKEEVKAETHAEVKAEEPKTEAKAETAEETEPETSEVLSPETHSLDPKLQEILDKRIGKEVAKRYKLNERIADLETKLSQLPTEVEKEVQVPVPSNIPLPEITTMEQLSVYRENLQNDIVEAEMLLYSDFPAEGKMTKWGHITKDGLIAALTQAKKDERTAIPARERFLTTRTQAQQTAQEKYPFLKDPTHPGYQMAKQALRENPILRNYPNAEYLVGMIVKGQLAEQDEAKGKVEAKAPPKPKAKPTNGQAEITSDSSMTRPPAGLVAQQALQAERAKIMGGKKSVSGKDFAELLKANSRYRNSQ
jgi:hypothetical protein